MQKTQNDCDGYSLLEIMAVLVIVSVMAIMSLPAMHSMIRSAEDKLLQTQIMRAVGVARMQSRMRHIGISICPSRDFQHCGGEWEEGMLVFEDGTCSGELHDHTQIISAVQFHDLSGVMRWRAFPATRQYLHIEPRRWITADNGMFLYCDRQTRKPRFAVVVNNVGGVRVKWADDDGNIEDRRHKILRCS